MKLVRSDTRDETEANVVQKMVKVGEGGVNQSCNRCEHAYLC